MPVAEKRRTVSAAERPLPRTPDENDWYRSAWAATFFSLEESLQSERTKGEKNTAPAPSKATEPSAVPVAAAAKPHHNYPLSSRPLRHVIVDDEDIDSLFSNSDGSTNASEKLPLEKPEPSVTYRYLVDKWPDMAKTYDAKTSDLYAPEPCSRAPISPVSQATQAPAIKPYQQASLPKDSASPPSSSMHSPVFSSPLYDAMADVKSVVSGDFDFGLDSGSFDAASFVDSLFDSEPVVIAPITLPKVRGMPDSMASSGNLSLNSVTSLKEAKAEIKNLVRQRPFSHCLDPGKDYTALRYYIPEESKAKPRAKPYPRAISYQIPEDRVLAPRQRAVSEDVEKLLNKLLPKIPHNKEPTVQEKHRQFQAKIAQYLHLHRQNRFDRS